MALRFFDANAYLGRPMQQGSFEPLPAAPELEAALSRAGIDKALVWHILQHDGSAITGNELLTEAIAGHEQLLGCWSILPPQTDGLITPDFFARMGRARVSALRAFPEMHRYLLQRVVFGNFLDEVAERRIPLLLSLSRAIDWPDIYHLLEQYPSLTCVLCDIGVWSVDRYTYPLLAAYENVYVETSLLALEDGGVESMCGQYGARRLVFGTGLPERYAESASLQLTHADISDEDRAAIASGNLERLLEEAQL